MAGKPMTAADTKIIKHMKGFLRHPKFMHRGERLRLGVHAEDFSWKQFWSDLDDSERKGIDQHYGAS